MDNLEELSINLNDFYLKNCDFIVNVAYNFNKHFI